MQTIEDVLEMLRLAGLTDEFVGTMIKWADRPQFPLWGAICQCGEGVLVAEDLSYEPPVRETIRASEVIRMILSPICETEINSSEVRLTSPASCRFFEENLGLARYYTIFLVAKLWALKHAPVIDEVGLKHLASVWDLEQYLKTLPNQDEVDMEKLIELCEGAGYPMELQGRLLPGQIPVDYKLDLTLKGFLLRKYKLTTEGHSLDIEVLRGTDSPGRITGCPWVPLIAPLQKWLDKHPNFPKSI